MSIHKLLAPPVWIGLVSVTGPKNNAILQGCSGAYSTFLTLAANERDFIASARDHATRLGLTLDEVVWCEKLAERLLRFEIEDYLVAAAEDVRVTGASFFGRFHAWEHEE